MYSQESPSEAAWNITDFVKTFSIITAALESLDLNHFLAESCDDKDYWQGFLLRGLCPFLNLK